MNNPSIFISAGEASSDARGSLVGTGIYFARLEAPDGVSVIKLALIR